MRLTFDTLIKRHYGTQGDMEKALGLGHKTVTRWYCHDPRRFLYYLEQLVVQTGMDANDILEMIIQRENDIRHLNDDHSRTEGVAQDSSFSVCIPRQEEELS